MGRARWAAETAPVEDEPPWREILEHVAEAPLEDQGTGQHHPMMPIVARAMACAETAMRYREEREETWPAIWEGLKPPGC